MVRYVGPAAEAVLARRPEAVIGEGRVQAWVIGSGTDPADRPPAEERALRLLLAGDVPLVVDAGALDLVSGARAPVVMTPHAGEHARLRARLGLGDGGEVDDDGVDDVVETARALGGVVMRKGARTVVGTPGGWSAVVSSGTAWSSTAGTGDVLAGALGAVIAAAGRPAMEQLGPLAATAAWLHGTAARLAAGISPGDDVGSDVGGRPITAMDLADALPAAVEMAVRAR